MFQSLGRECSTQAAQRTRARSRDRSEMSLDNHCREAKMGMRPGSTKDLEVGRDCQVGQPQATQCKGWKPGGRDLEMELPQGLV